MKKHVLLLTISLFLMQSVFAQINYDTVYAKTYGNTAYHTEGVSVVEAENDSLLLATGYYGGLNYCDWRPKLYYANATGDTIWSNLTSIGNGPLIKTYDNNFVNGRRIETPANCSLDTILVSKFNPLGDTIWTRKFYFGTCNNYIKDIIETSDSGLAVICFYSYTGCSNPAYNSALIKLDKNGAIQWIKHFGTSVETLEAMSIVQTSDNDFGIICFTIEGIGRCYRLIKTDSAGNTIWDQLLYNGTDVAGYCDVDLLPNNNFLIAGTTSGGFIGRVDTTGTITMFHTFPIAVIGSTFIMNVKYLPNHNSYLFVTDKFFVTDTSGSIVGSSMSFNSSFKKVIQLSNTDLVGIGFLYSGNEKIFLVRLHDAVPTSINQDFFNSGIRVYPNPFSESATFEFDNPNREKHNLIIYNTYGQPVLSYSDITTEKIVLEKTTLSSGVYFYKLSTTEGVVGTGKLIME